jgi:hypothetical protein
MHPREFTEEELLSASDIIWNVMEMVNDSIGSRFPTQEEGEALMLRCFNELRDRGETGPFDDFDRLRAAVSARLDQLEQEKEERDRMDEALLRTIIKETLLSEAMYTPARAAEEGISFHAVRTQTGRGGWHISCYQDRMNIGGLSIRRTPVNGVYKGAYEVTMSKVPSDFRGLGPLVYDIAMELAGESGMMPDRESVSPAARGVWQRYLTDRPDVDHEQIDPIPGMITPDDWVGSPLSKVYRKAGTPVLDRLMELGIIQITG